MAKSIHGGTTTTATALGSSAPLSRGDQIAPELPMEAPAGASLLRERGVATTGLTANERIDFVESLGVYDEVLDYNSIDQLDITPTTLVDIAGDAAHRHQLAARLGDALLHTIMAGFTRTTGTPLAFEEADAEALFSAPERIVERTRQWGRHDFDARVEQSLQHFSSWAHDWIELIRIDRPEEVERAYHRVRLAQAAPAQGLLLTLSCTSTSPSPFSTPL